MQAIQKIRHRQADVNGLEVVYREAGHPDRPTVLLLHGPPSSSHTFREVMPPLAELAHVIAPDLPGFGLSSSPTVDEYAYTSKSLSWTIEHLLELWGRHDPYFDIDEVLAYHRALERVDAHIFDAGHLLLETHAAECAELMRAFVLDNT